eukprot:2418922-Prymnesium_polylepis.1
MPTTLPAYKAVPTPSDFKLLEPAHVKLQQNLFGAGVQIYTAISDTCRNDFEQALHSASPPIVE